MNQCCALSEKFCLKLIFLQSPGAFHLTLPTVTPLLFSSTQRTPTAKSLEHPTATPIAVHLGLKNKEKVNTGAMSQPKRVLPHHAWLYRHATLAMQGLVENVECYVPGGYHPTDIGDTITNDQDSYTVVHKLGYGGYSTVWLVKRQRKHCVGQQQDPPPVSFHALKILRSEIGNTRVDNELHFLQRLGQVGKFSHPNIAMIEDSFTISGPNGQHQCFVSPVLGLSLYSISIKKLTPSQRHHICQQLASAVAFLHSHGICHGGKTLYLSIRCPAYCDHPTRTHLLTRAYRSQT